MLLHCEGTYMMGDLMMYLNLAHIRSYMIDKQVTLHFHWRKGEDTLYHYEDPELSKERCEYIHNFYRDSWNVKTIHTFNDNANADLLHEYKIVTDRDYNRSQVVRPIIIGEQKNTRTWFLEESRLPKTIPKKLVFWRPSFNRELPRKWKLAVNHEEWNKAINIMKRQGYNPVELTYRTPIREALYHIASSDLVMCYDGMWHYISVMLFKPTITVASSTIGMYNTFNSVIVRGWPDMRRLLHNWDKKRDYWDVKKHDPETDGVVPVRRYQEYNMTGKQYVEKINRKMKGWMDLAYEKKIDWSKYPIMNDDDVRMKYLGI